MHFHEIQNKFLQPCFELSFRSQTKSPALQGFLFML